MYSIYHRVDKRTKGQNICQKIVEVLCCILGTCTFLLYSEGHQNHITGSKVTAILLKGWILPIGGVASGRVCACSLRSRLVSTNCEL